MAVNSSASKKLASLGQRFVAQISSNSSPTPSLAALLPRRSIHGSVYDKNVEDHVRPVVVPDHIIQLQSDKYWAPNPHTGVFGPAAEHNLGAGGERGHHASAANGGTESVLEQKAFFRPQEDLEKPEQA
ncbi:hypothetical protein KSS87_003785 [Heliosperma pusillum]|nr:hypothetical protein KSS87_003785 [Heliosperma pusillum]